MADIIERLKNNTRLNFMLTDEEFEVFVRAGKKNREITSSGVWPSWRSDTAENFDREMSYIHRLKADYQPDSEIEWCGVLTARNNTNIYYERNGNCPRIYKALADPDLYRFRWKNGDENLELRRIAEDGTVEYPVAVLFRKGK